jgi:hypothetical protein
MRHFRSTDFISGATAWHGFPFDFKRCRVGMRSVMEAWDRLAGVLTREASGVRPACWRCGKTGAARKREQAPRHSKRFAQFGFGFAALFLCFGSQV